MPSARKSKPSCVRPAWRSTSEIKRRPSSVTGAPAKSTIRLPLREEGNYPTRLMCHCLEVSHSGLLHLGATGVCRKPAKRRRETRHFCDVFLQRLQTKPPVIDGSTKPWNAGGVATSPEGRCAGSCSLEGVSAPPQGPQLPCLLPTWQGAPT